MYGTEMLYETQNVVQGDLSSNFYGEQTEFIAKRCVCYFGCVG